MKKNTEHAKDIYDRIMERAAIVDISIMTLINVKAVPSGWYLVYHSHENYGIQELFKIYCGQKKASRWDITVLEDMAERDLQKAIDKIQQLGDTAAGEEA